MAERAASRMTADAFLAWAEGREGRFELVEGAIVGMAGARERHDEVVLNVLVSLRTQLRGSACRVFTGDTGVIAPGGNVRRPDAGVNCAPRDADALAARDPRLVVEVLSPSTRHIDLQRKLDEYRALPGLAYILLIEPDIPQVMLWSRAGAEWLSQVFDTLTDRFELPTLGIWLALADLYENVPLPPRLVT